MRDAERTRRRAGRIAAATMTAAVLMAGAACDSEPRIDPERERNIRPGQRPEGSPRDEEA